jgi:hypothetical protein
MFNRWLIPCFQYMMMIYMRISQEKRRKKASKIVVEKKGNIVPYIISQPYSSNPNKVFLIKSSRR